MITLTYTRKQHAAIVRAVVTALKQGKVVAYPTDTSYGLACDVTNLRAVKKLYAIKERGFNKPVHIIAPSIAYCKKVARWNAAAAKLAKKFWPGPLTVVLPLTVRLQYLVKLSGGTGTVGLRQPQHEIALGVAKLLGKPISTTSANPSGKKSGGYDSYSARDVIKQFTKKKHKPDIILDAGKLPKRKPSTIVTITGSGVEILRHGPVSEKQILNTIRIHNKD